MKLITLPDGSEIEFPDEMSDAQIASALSSTSSSSAASARDSVSNPFKDEPAAAAPAAAPVAASKPAAKRGVVDSVIDFLKPAPTKSVMEGYDSSTVAAGQNSPVSQKFVDDLRRDVIGSLPVEKRMPALRELARAEGPYGAAAKALLQQAEQENKINVVDKLRDEELYKAAKAAPPVAQNAPPPGKGGKQLPTRVAIPDVTPSIQDMREGTSEKDIAERRAFAGGMSDWRQMDRLTDPNSATSQLARKQKAAEFRSIGEWAADTTLSLASGATSLASIPFNLTDPGSDLAVSLRETAKKFDDARSETSIASQQVLADRLKNEDGFLNKYAATVVELVTNPTLAINETVKQLPNFLGVLGLGKLLAPAGAAAGGGAVKLAEKASPMLALSEAISGGAIQTGARTAGGYAGGAAVSMSMAASDAAGNVYERLTDPKQTPVELWEKNPDYKELVKIKTDRLLAKGVEDWDAEKQASQEAIKEIATAKARLAGLAASPAGLLGFMGTEASVVSRGLANTVAQSFGVKPAAKLFVKDNLGEQAEEGLTQAAGNAVTRTVDPSVSLTEGVAQAMGTAAVTSAPFSVYGAAGQLIDPNATVDQAPGGDQINEAVDKWRAGQRAGLIAGTINDEVLQSRGGRTEPTPLGPVNEENVAKYYADQARLFGSTPLTLDERDELANLASQIQSSYQMTEADTARYAELSNRDRLSNSLTDAERTAWDTRNDGRIEPTTNDEELNKFWSDPTAKRIEPTTNFTPADSPSAQAGLAPIVVPNVELGAVEAGQVQVSALNQTGGTNVGTLGNARIEPSLGSLPGSDQPGGSVGVPGLGAGSTEPVGGVDATKAAANVGENVAAERGAGERPASLGQLPKLDERASDSDLLARITQAQQDNNNANMSVDPAQPITIWTGRSGDGYATEEAAQAGLESRLKRDPDLDWKIEQMPSGKFRLAGYDTEAATVSASAAAEPVTDAAAQDQQAEAPVVAPEPITAPSGQPFSTKQVAGVYAQQQGIKGASIVRSGNGWIIQPQETSNGTQTTQTFQAKAQGQEAPVASARQADTVSNLLAKQPALPDALLTELSRNESAEANRTAVQSYLNDLVTEGKMERAPTMGAPDVEAEKRISALGRVLGDSLGIGNRVVAYSDPGGENGFAIGNIAFVNTWTDKNSVSAPRTVFHEIRHVAEQLARGGSKAAQDFTAKVDSIFDDINDDGKRSYITNFLHKEELQKITSPAAREAKIQEYMTAEKTLSEMVADFIGNRATDREFMVDLAKADPKGFKAFAERWLAVIDNMIAKLRGGPKQSQQESAKVDQYVRDLNKSKMVVRDALVQFRKDNLGEQAQPDLQGQGAPAASARQINDPEFKKFFGKSKVVDENGEPLVVYHGTKDDITQFDESKTVDGGFHFGSVAQANMRVSGSGKNIMPVYLSAQNLQRSKDMGGNWKAKIKAAKAAGRDGIVYLNRYEGLTSEVISRLSDKGLLDKLDRMSDAEFRRAVPEAEDSYIVFKPTQIKSATGNVGAYSQRPITAEEAASRGMTVEEANAAQARGDISFSRREIKPATTADTRKAKAYEKEHGILPYTSEGQLEIPVGTVVTPSFSIKQQGKYGNHPLFDIPVNANGTVSMYYPTTNAEGRRVARDKTMRAAPGSNRIYLTNESSAPKVMGNRGNIEQDMEGANVLVQVDPSLLQLDMEHADGRKDFFIPIAEGKAFFDKMKMTRLFTQNAPRNKALTKDTKLTDLERRITDGIDKYVGLTKGEQRIALKEAKAKLKREHNVTTLLGVNGKLEKTNTGGYGLNNYDGKDVKSMGLGLASAQKINENNLSTCPKSAICESLCLGETSGQNLLYGGDGQYKSGPRLAQYLKTEAMVVNPEAFAVVLHSEISKLARDAKKEDYQATVRLNVTSDFRPQTFDAIIKAFPDVVFYDYTKLPSKSIAENHHLTYSSTGASQVVDGKTIVNPESNWNKMVEVMRRGDNVAMAFSDKNTMPAYVVDEKSGEKFQVWNGDNYDARFLDPKPGQEGNEFGKGMIIGLTNKDRTGKPEQAAEKNKGFFVDYNPERDGDTVVIKNQDILAGGLKFVPIKEIRTAERKDEMPAFSKSQAETEVKTNDEVVKLFTDLQNARGLKGVRAKEAAAAHPMGEQIVKINNDFYDILEKLDDAGLIKINC